MLACPVCATPERDGRGRNVLEEVFHLSNGMSWLRCLNPDCGHEFTEDEAAEVWFDEKHQEPRLICGHLLEDIIASNEGTHFCVKCAQMAIT